jgi:hypothetical protein
MKPKIHFLSSADHSEWEDGISKADGLPIRDSGVWIEKKHKPLVYFSEIFNQAMKDKPWEQRVYLELFAGPGRCFVRETKEEKPGSPLQVLETNYTKFIFVEMSQEAAGALAQRITGHPKASTVEIWCGSCTIQIDLYSGRKSPVGYLGEHSDRHRHQAKSPQLYQGNRGRSAAYALSGYRPVERLAYQLTIQFFARIPKIIRNSA